MSTNKYKFVKDSNGELIDIDNITQDNKKNDYYCIECGDTMIAAFGQKRKYFRHKGEVTCNRESYLHKLGKMFFKQSFEKNNTFPIQYLAESKCTKSDCRIYNATQRIKSCPTQQIIVALNLKDYYDVCEEESRHQGFVADLKLYCSQHPEREPTFIEIYTTHKCDPQKIESGIRIIEITIKNEEDVLTPLNDFNNSKVTFYNFKFNRFIQIEKKFSYYALIQENNELKYKIGELLCTKNEKKSNIIVQCILPYTTKIDKIRTLELYSLSIFAKNNQLKYCPFCIMYHHKRCAVKISTEQIHKGTKRVLIQKIPVREYPGNYFQLAEQCKNYICYSNHKIIPPQNIIQTIY